MNNLGLLRIDGLGAAIPAPQDGLVEICSRAGDGDRNALGELFEGLADDLYGFALWSCASPEAASEALSSLFERLIEEPHRLAGVRSPRPYLFRAIAREARRIVKRRNREQPLADEPCFVLGQDRAPDLDLSRALAQLPRPQREALYLRYFAGFEYAEIGRATGVSRFTAASRCRLGLERLRRRLGANG